MTIDALHCEILTYLLRTEAVSWPGGLTELTVLDNWRGQKAARWMAESMGYRRAITLDGTAVGTRGIPVNRAGHYVGKKEDFESHLRAGRCAHEDVRHLVLASLKNAELKAIIAEFLRATTKAVIVDEVFDANELDLALVWLAAEEGLSVTVIGDPWQALYDFRGARPDLVPGMVEAGAFTTYPVSRSFRFTTDTMRTVAEKARSGAPVSLATSADIAECDVVLARKWKDLWDVADCVLPLSFGRLANQTDYYGLRWPRVLVSLGPSSGVGTGAVSRLIWPRLVG